MGSSSSKKQATGRRYSFDLHMGLGLPLDEICEIQASDKSAWKGSITTNGQIRINAPELFGGDKGEGGLDGTLDVMFGDEDQVPVSKLTAMLSQLGGIVAGFRGQTTAFYSGLVTSNNPYPKPWKFLRRGGNRLWSPDSAWYPEKQFIWLADGQVKAMNPVHMLYLIYTGKRFRRRPRALMDDAAWRVAADTIYAEGLGLCLEWKRSDSFKTFRDTVLSHISAEVYLDRRKALISIRLLRDDYNIDDLPLFDEDRGLLDITRDESSSNDSSSVPSIMVVKYVDAIDGKTKQVKAVNSAVAARDGGQTAQVKDYPGAPTGDIAGRLCVRDMRLATSGLKRFKVILDRRGRYLTPGAPFRVRSIRRGIGEIVLRVGRFEDGTLTDGRVTVTALQDVFSLPATSYVAVPPAGWAPPDRTPHAVVARRVFELPYFTLAGSIDPANLQQLDSTETFAAAVAAAPTSMSLSYDLTDRVGSSGDFIVRTTGDWCPTGLLTGALAKESGPSSAMVSSYARLDEVVVGSAAMIDDEVVRVDAVNYDTGALTLARGCADTVPVEHAASSRIWFFDGFEAVDETAYTQGVSLQLRMLTRTSQGVLDPALAGTDTLSTQGRQGRPYPPGQFKIAGSYYPAAVNGSFLVTWSHRDRSGQADQVIDTTIGNIGPQSGTTYTVRVRRADTGALLTEQTGLTGTTSNPISLTYTGNVDIQLFAVVGGVSSLFMHSHRVAYTPPIVQSVLLLNMEGTDGSTTFVDAKGHAMTAAGNAHITTSSPFGTSSAILDGSGDWIETAGVSDFVFGTGPFTVEAWINTSAVKEQALIDFFTSAASGWQLELNSSGRLVWYRNATVLTGATNLFGAGWRHVAITRDESSVLRCFAHGVLDGSVVDSANYATLTSKLAIGAQVASRNASYDFNGCIGPVRITKNKAWYNASFTPPTGPFSTDS